MALAIVTTALGVISITIMIMVAIRRYLGFQKNNLLLILAFIAIIIGFIIYVIPSAPPAIFFATGTFIAFLAGISATESKQSLFVSIAVVYIFVVSIGIILLWR